jgi:hypothetical protein
MMSGHTFVIRQSRHAPFGHFIDVMPVRDCATDSQNLSTAPLMTAYRQQSKPSRGRHSRVDFGCLTRAFIFWPSLRLRDGFVTSFGYSRRR